MSAKWRPFCSNRDMLTHWGRVTHIYVSRLGHHQFKWWIVAWSAPSNYLKQWWIIVNWTHGNKLRWICNRNSNIFIEENAFENVVCKMSAILCRCQCVNSRDFMTINTRWLMMTSSNGNIFRVTGHLCGEFTVSGEFPTQRPVTRSFDVYFDLRPNKRLSKQSLGWWFETLSPPLWRHRNVSECCLVCVLVLVYFGLVPDW